MIFLSFDIEEFDNPFPCSQQLSFEEQMKISVQGTKIILDLLAKCEVAATFFCTANFALHAPHLVNRMVADGHEVASHGYFHNRFEPQHLRQSREVLEKLTAHAVSGFRMPNMAKIAPEELTDAGYRYNSSLNPTYLPGKYNNFRQPRRIFKESGIYQIPASVSPGLRVPLFWLALHNFPIPFYNYLLSSSLKKDGYLNLYFHPWEFVALKPLGMKLPFYVERNSGGTMAHRLERVIRFFKAKNIPFGRLNECAALFG